MRKCVSVCLYFVAISVLISSALLVLDIVYVIRRFVHSEAFWKDVSAYVFFFFFFFLSIVR